MGNYNVFEERAQQEFAQRYIQERKKAYDKELRKETETRSGLLYEFSHARSMCEYYRSIDAEEFAKWKAKESIVRNNRAIFLEQFVSDIDDKLMKKIKAKLEQEQRKILQDW